MPLAISGCFYNYNEVTTGTGTGTVNDLNDLNDDGLDMVDVDDDVSIVIDTNAVHPPSTHHHHHHHHNQKEYEKEEERSHYASLSPHCPPALQQNSF